MTYHTNVVRFGEPDLRFRHDLKWLNVVRFDKPDLKSRYQAVECGQQVHWAGRPSVGETTVVRFDEPALRSRYQAVECGQQIHSAGRPSVGETTVVRFPDLRFWHDLKRLNVVRFGEHVVATCAQRDDQACQSRSRPPARAT
jgi:hypothetical protein